MCYVICPQFLSIVRHLRISNNSGEMNHDRSWVVVIVVKNDGTIALINRIIAATCIRMSASIINGYVIPINRDL